MPTTPDRVAALDRAYVQSRVIETGLERLAATMSQVDPELRDGLASYLSIFDEYVRRLRNAKMVADATEH